ncbi:MAG: DUF3604 domain-containing protein [bacterium]|nr:DUF3604 domain-containing protein [bacterium]
MTVSPYHSVYGVRLLAVCLVLICTINSPARGDAEIPVAAKPFAQASITPDYGVAGEYGSWTLHLRLNETLDTGGVLRAEFPDVWFSGPRNSANRLQSTDPKGDFYVSADCSNSGVEIKAEIESETDQWLVKHSKNSLDCRSERYVFVIRVTLTRGQAAAGDEIRVVLGDRSHGSAGYRAGVVSTEPLPVQIAADLAGDGSFQRLPDPPKIEIRPGAAVDMLLVLPSQAVAGQSSQGLLSVIDKEANAVAHEVVADLSLLTGEADIPKEVRIPPRQGFVRFSFTPSRTGVIRIKARAVAQELETRSNPCETFDSPPGENILWGDLHSHTHYSWDGVGYNPFEYARDVSGLDFYAKTDHAISPDGEWTRGLGPQNWDEYNRETDRYNDPPRFTAIHAYECSLGRPYGHHNVYFKNEPGALVPNTGATLVKLWSALQKGQALTIPHHTGKFPAGIDFSIHDPELRRNIEIYSGHGLSEEYNPQGPLSFENSLFTSDAKSLRDPSYVQDAWRMGLQLSAIASSDDHRAHPGQLQYGLAAVMAPANSREDVFNALYNRRTYAVCGERIILRFLLNGAAMGSTVIAAPDPRIVVEAHGSDLIEWVEVLRLRAGDDDFSVIHRDEPAALDYRLEWTDACAASPGAVYYVRLRQVNQVRGRAVMAWSSPIWLQ